MTSVMAEDCTAEPMPKDAMAANRAKSPGAGSAHQGVLPFLSVKPRFHAYMAPPSMSPL